MNRAELQQLTRERIRDVKALLAAHRWSGAYYLAGYAVECALKSCVVRYLMATDQFPERKFSEQCWTHNLGQLLNLAGLKAAFDADAAKDRELLANWTAIKEWDETTRYTRTKKTIALRLYRAITDPKHGVLQWCKSRW